MEEALGVFVFEDFDGEGELSTKLLVHLFHDHQRDVLMAHPMNEGVFEHMAERPVPDVVQEDGSLHRFCLAVEDKVSLLLQREDGFAHQVEGSERVLQTGVLCSGIDDVGTAQLLDAAETVEGRMTHDVEQQTAWHTDEPEHGVVDDFSGLHTTNDLRRKCVLTTNYTMRVFYGDFFVFRQRIKRIERIF